MKNKHLILGLALVAVVAAAGWFGRAAWRAHRNLVTLHVRNAPLAQVVRQLEHQTWEKIRVATDLDARVTLDVKDLPLPQVLDLLTETAGVAWSEVYAVYDSRSALRRLESALRANSSLDAAGWTNLIPHAAETVLSGTNAFAHFDGFQHLPEAARQAIASAGTGSNQDNSFSPHATVIKLNGNDSNGGSLEAALRDHLKNRGLAGSLPDGSNGDQGQTFGSRKVVVKMNGQEMQGGNLDATLREQLKAQGLDASVQESVANALRDALAGKSVALAGSTNIQSRVIVSKPVVRFMHASDDGGDETVTEEVSPQRLVLESRLAPRLGNAVPDSVSDAAAKSVAKQVCGRWTRCYALRNARPGEAIARRIMNGISASGSGQFAGILGTNGESAGSMTPESAASGAEAMIRRQKAEEFSKLTPEQRVARARELQQLKSKTQ